MRQHAGLLPARDRPDERHPGGAARIEDLVWSSLYRNPAQVVAWAIMAGRMQSRASSSLEVYGGNGRT
jgi:hypothetical protein